MLVVEITKSIDEHFYRSSVFFSLLRHRFISNSIFLPTFSHFLIANLEKLQEIFSSFAFQWREENRHDDSTFLFPLLPSNSRREQKEKTTFSTVYSSSSSSSSLSHKRELLLDKSVVKSMRLIVGKSTTHLFTVRGKRQSLTRLTQTFF